MKRYTLQFFFYAFLFSFSLGYSQTLDTNLWVTNGQVNCVVQSGNTIYVGGNFWLTGPARPGGAIFDTATANLYPLFPRIYGVVYTVIPDGSGGYYFGGNFTKVGNIKRNNLAHVDANGSVTNWNPNANQSVNKIKKDGNIIYIGGYFTVLNGQPRKHIATVDAINGNLLPWNPSANKPVRNIAIYNSSIVYVSGDFDTISGSPRKYFAALDATTGIANSWNPNPNNGSGVFALAGSRLYVGGTFTNISGLSRGKLAAYDAPTGNILSWNPTASADIYSIAPSGSDVYIGGAFTSFNGQSKSYLVVVDTITGALKTWNGFVGSITADIVVTNSRVYLAGYSSGGIGVIDRSTGINVAAFQQQLGQTSCIAVSGSSVFVGGYFESLLNTQRMGLAAFDAITGVALPWNPTVQNGYVSHMFILNGKLYIAGTFKFVGGQARNSVASVNLSSGNVTSWNPNANNAIYGMATDGKDIYVGGGFTNIGSQPRNYIAALDTGTGLATSWNPNANSLCRAMAINGSRLYVSGSFSTIASQSRQSLASFDIGTGNITAWNPAATSTMTFINTLVPKDNRVYIGGSFLTMGGQPRKYIAAVDTTSGNALPWNPSANADVKEISASGPRVYAIGNFSSIGGQPRAGLASLDTSIGLSTNWDAKLQPSGSGASIDICGSTVYASGAFWGVLGEIRRFAKLTGDSSNTITGKVFYDLNGNGIQDTGELPRSHCNILLLPDNSIFETDSNGVFTIFCNKGTFTVSPILPLYALSSIPANHSILFNGNFQVSPSNDFALQMQANIDDKNVILSQVTPARPSFSLIYHLKYKNVGTNLESGTVKLVMDSRLTFDSCSVPYTSLLSDTLSWAFTNLLPSQEKNIRILVNVPGSVSLGDTITSIASIEPIAGDQTPIDNYDTLKSIVIGAYDPNCKTVDPLGSDTIGTIVSFSSYLNYNIRFQNTGTYLATNITITDTLDSDLDISTFEMISVSHNYTFKIERNVITWTFLGIMLPDSNTSEPLSHGYLSYKIKFKQNLTDGTQIKNKADIYFDFNLPITTNSTLNTISAPLSIATLSNNGNIIVYPNPFSDNVSFVVTNKIAMGLYTLTLYDMFGKVVKSITDINSNQFTLNANGLEQGVYFYKIYSSSVLIDTGKIILKH